MICYTNKSEDTLLSCPLKYTYTHIFLCLALSVSHTNTHALIPLHGPLGFVVAKSLNKLRNDWNWKMSNGDSSAVPSQYGDDEIWFFEVRYIIRAERLPRLWLKEIGGHSLSHVGFLPLSLTVDIKSMLYLPALQCYYYYSSPLKQARLLYVNHMRSIR